MFYYLVEETTAKNFEAECTWRLRNGWAPLGGPTIIKSTTNGSLFYFQAFTKP